MNMIAQQLAQRQQQGLLRSLRPAHHRQTGSLTVDGRALIDLGSNDYLSLSSHPKLKQAAKEAIDRYGTGAGASRLLSGDFEWFHELEARTAGFKGKESALVLNSGYQANVGLMASLCGKGDAIFCDRLSHASLLDGIRLSEAKLFRFQHNDIDHLESLLIRHSTKFTKCMVVTESVFSMDGDLAPLQAIASLKARFGFTWFLDEAHATGVFGPNGSGLAAQAGVTDSVDLLMGTFGKALGSFGAYVACSIEMKQWLINTCRSFIYSTALPPGVIAANLAALALIESEPYRRIELLKRADALRERLKTLGFDVRGESQIIPVILGATERAVTLSGRLEDAGFRAQPLRPPTVPVGQSRLRVSLCYDHDQTVVDRLAACLEAVGDA